MPGENIQDWSVTALSNGNADSAINWLEGQPRASVNDSARSMMAAHAKDRNLRNGSIVTAGTANAQTFLSGLTYTAVPTGLRCTLKVGPGLTNTGPTTLNMDGIGAVAIKEVKNAGDVIASEIVAGQYIDLIYNGTNWILLNCYPQFADKAATAFSVTGIADGTIAPAAGMVGELIRAETNVSSAVFLPTGTAVWVANFTLTAGDWDVSGAGGIIVNADVTSDFQWFMWIGDGTMTSLPLTNSDYFIAGLARGISSAYYINNGIAARRVALATAQAYHLYGLANFAAGSVQMFGAVNCRRAR